MSQISFMERLLDETEVKWEPLGKVLVRTKGTKITAGRMKELHKDNAPLKIFAGGKTIAFVDFKDIPEKNINREPSIIVKSRGVIEFEYYDNPFSHKNEMWSYHSKNKDINIKYIYYFLKMQEPYFQKLASRMQMPQIATPDTDKFQIPIPSPEVQTKIVCILDNFTELTAELIAELTIELTARKKQYSYYRDKLLTFDEGDIEWKSLGEVTEYSKTRIGFNFLNKSNYVGVDNLLQNRAGKKESKHIPTEGNSTKYHHSDILIGNIRPYLKKIWHADCTGGTNGDVLVIHPTDKSVNPQYLYQILADEKFFEYNMKHAKGAKMPRGNKVKIMEYRFPIPSPEKQKHIVNILNKFNTLTNSISDGLACEIELRQKKYNYYRDMLLSFSKPEIEV